MPKGKCQVYLEGGISLVFEGTIESTKQKIEASTSGFIVVKHNGTQSILSIPRIITCEEISDVIRPVIHPLGGLKKPI